MSRQSWQETLINSLVDGAALSNTLTATSLIPAAAKLTLPANYLAVGSIFKVTAQGRISTVVTTPGTLTLDIRLGAVIAANGGAMTLSTTAKTNVSFWLEWILTCRAIGNGTSTNFMHQGSFTSEAAGATTVVGEAKTIMLPQSAPAVGTGFDSTVAQAIDLFGTWSVANAANSIQVHQFKVESLT